MGKSKDGNVTCFMYTQMRIVGLVRRHINPYGRYHFDLTRLERGSPPGGSAEA